MSPTAHGLINWLISQPLHHRRERCLVTYAGLVPDIDGLGSRVAVIMRRTSRSIFEIFGERFDQVARRLYRRFK